VVAHSASWLAGQQELRDRAFTIGSNALIRGIRILVITSDDLRTLTKPADLIRLLYRRNNQLTASATVYLGP